MNIVDSCSMHTCVKQLLVFICKFVIKNIIQTGELYDLYIRQATAYTMACVPEND